MSVRILLVAGILWLSGCSGTGDAGVTFFNMRELQSTEAWYGLDIADMGGDGLQDIVATSTFNDGNFNVERRINVFLQSPVAPGEFPAPVTVRYGPLGASAWNVAAIDLTQGGQPEVVVQHVDEGGFLVFEQDPASAGTVLQPIHYGPSEAGASSFAAAMAVGDIDGDTFTDVLLTSGDRLVYYPQDSGNPGTFMDGIEVGVGIGAVTLGDINDDGLTDLLSFRTHPDASDMPVPDTLLYYRQDPLVPERFLQPIELPFDFRGKRGRTSAIA